MKQIRIALLTHLQGYATTWCYLMRVDCVGKWAGLVRGFTSLDDVLVYNDGQGAITYKPDNGFAPSKFQITADFSVDNAEMTGFITDDEITEADILAGIFDFATVAIYRVNYMRPQDGHEVVNFGTFGETKFDDAKWHCEFRSLMQQAKQPFGNVYSLTCRAQFGDSRCKMPFTWTAGTVTEQVEDNLMGFRDAALSGAAGAYVPGVLEWTAGPNKGVDMDVEFNDALGFVRLILPMPMPIGIGDAYKIRPDCDKTDKMCLDVYDNLIEFRGEHLIPIADTGLSVPGAYISQDGAK